MTPMATTLDALYGDALTLYQPKKAYRFGSDAMILAAAIRARPGQTILELGGGVGAVTLAGAVRLPKCRFTAIEREAAYAALLERNIVHNGMDARVTVVQGDIADKALAKKMGTFDHVVANPPFYKVQPKANSKSALRKAARAEENDTTLAEWVQAANRFLKPKGTVTFLHCADRVPELIPLFEKFCGAVTVFPLWPRAGKSAKRVVIQGTKGSRAPFVMAAGLVLHDAGEKYYTDAASAVIRRGADLWQAGDAS
jgi:tRNA1(Val) A37 N6-methylase TrmN6